MTLTRLIAYSEGVPRLILVIVLVAIVVYAFVVAVRMNPKNTPAGINKWVWVIFTIVPPIVGSIIFLVANYVNNSRNRPKGTGPDYLGPLARDKGPRPGPMAPDDDPDFLRELEEELRRAQYDKKLRDHEDDSDSSSQ